MKKIASALVAAAALAACSVALAAGTLNGAYTTKIGSQPLGGQLKGTWTIDFHDGSYTVTTHGTVVVRGKYSIHGSKVSLSSGSGQSACPAKAPGVYTFKLTGGKLTFKKDSGPKQCVGRDTVLSYPFTKGG